MKTQQMTKYILGGVIAVGLALFCASSNAQAKEKKMNEALTINRDGAQRNPGIHWPKGQDPEDADLYAHNERSCTRRLHSRCGLHLPPSDVYRENGARFDVGRRRST